MENGIKERKKKVSAENKPVKQRQPKAEGVAEKEKAAVKPRKTVIKVEELYREYAKLSHGDEETESIKVLKGLDFVVKEQEFVGIMGKSGCGKTTLLKTLGLIDKPTKGNLYFCGKETRKLWNDELADIRRREIGFVFQDFYLMDSLSVSENIMLPMVLDKKNVRKCMEKGKEPTGNLGSKSGKIVIDALERINRKMKKTIIMVTHDPQVASHCKRIIFLKDGVILEDLRRKGASEEEFYEKIIERMKDL